MTQNGDDLARLGFAAWESLSPDVSPKDVAFVEPSSTH